MPTRPEPNDVAQYHAAIYTLAMNAKMLHPLGFAWALTAAVWLGPSPAHAQPYSVDGMVGQVNGRAIYTSTVLEPIRDQLVALGRELPRETFRKRAAALIVSRLNGMITDALIYGEAQRDLSEQERQGLTGMTANQRENLLREFGQGSPALAEVNIMKKTGLTLDQTLDQWRQTVVVQRYLQQKLYPKINVTRKDVKRYYLDHYDEFNPPSQRKVCVIQVASPTDAQHIRARLDEGTSFIEVAKDPTNLFRREDGGLMGAMAGNQLFADETVNQATLDLNTGEYAGPIQVGDRLWFVHVQEVIQPESRPLKDVQVQIHTMLFEQQLRDYSQRYRERLFEQGSYNSIEQMTMSLLEITMDRYARTDR